MSDLAFALASTARRAGLVAALCRHRGMLTLEQLDHLVHRGDYAEELAGLSIAELVGGERPELPPLAIRAGESTEVAVMRVFDRRQGVWLASSLFVRHLGLQRWTAQKVLADLAARGLLERRGSTSSTRYRFVLRHLLDSCIGRNGEPCP